MRSKLSISPRIAAMSGPWAVNSNTQPFEEMIWVTTGGDMETINRLTDILVTMNTPADREKLFKIIKMLYGRTQPCRI